MSNIINVARGFEKADLVIKNANIVNVLSEEIHKADIAIVDGIIAGIGENYSGEKEIDVNGAYVTPSFIDGHVHLESTMMLPSEFAKVALPAGTTTVIIDPHEISNVLGLHGISFMHETVKICLWMCIQCFRPVFLQLRLKHQGLTSTAMICHF